MILRTVGAKELPLTGIEPAALGWYLLQLSVSSQLTLSWQVIEGKFKLYLCCVQFTVNELVDDLFKANME